MNHGFWVWPADLRERRKVLIKVAGTGQLVKALSSIAKSKAGLSNSELDDLIADNSAWMTLWVVRQLTSLGFIEYKVDLFGEAAKYQITELGRNALAFITGQPPPVKPAVAPAQSQPVASKA